MTESTGPRKGARWLAERITAGVDPGQGDAGRRLSRDEIDALVDRVLDKELERVEGEEPDPGP